MSKHIGKMPFIMSVFIKCFPVLPHFHDLSLMLSNVLSKLISRIPPGLQLTFFLPCHLNVCALGHVLIKIIK